MHFARRNGAAKRSRPLSVRLLIVSSVAAVIGISGICTGVLLDMRRSEQALAQQMIENLATGIDADISRNIELYDLSLRAVVANIVLPEAAGVSRSILHLILFDHALAAKHFGAIQVFDAQGRLTIDASSLDPLPENRSDEDYFRIHRDNPDAGLFISRPMLHRGTYAIVLSRRITGADGSFLGVAAGSIHFSYFHALFERLSLDPDDTITVLRNDRTIIMRKPFDLDIIGKSLVGRPTWNPANLPKDGAYSGLGPVDSIPRLYVRRSSTSPLFVVVGKPLDNILALWRDHAIKIGAVMLALIAFVLVGALFLAREIARRAQAEHLLEEMATTDALTGLRNRRKFDATIESEWRRAMRYGTSISLLMIDADHFKMFNDSYGHQAGDQVLIGIAICIADSVRRGGDCAARYGGEEFAVLLPGQSAEQALAVAETIRRKVAGWSDDPATTTVSIGVASVRPVAPMDWPALVNCADKALYAAKAGGRNRCAMASVPPLSLAA
jgi:diguanylate cyclase (GGDEF)-like protein